MPFVPFVPPVLLPPVMAAKGLLPLVVVEWCLFKIYLQATPPTTDAAKEEPPIVVVVSAAKKVAVGVEDGESTEVLVVGEVRYVSCILNLYKTDQVTPLSIDIDTPRQLQSQGDAGPG